MNGRFSVRYIQVNQVRIKCVLFESTKFEHYTIYSTRATLRGILLLYIDGFCTELTINDRFDEQFTLMSIPTIPRIDKFYTTVLSVTRPDYN